MSLIVTNVQEQAVLTTFLTPALTMRLYSNDKTPSGNDSVADYTEVIGGGYANKPLTFANWAITPGAPTIALYNAVQSWVFTGPTNAPGTVYGYYITRNSDGLLMYAERFPSGSLPFSPIVGSVVRITPKITCESA